MSLMRTRLVAISILVLGMPLAVGAATAAPNGKFHSRQMSPGKPRAPVGVELDRTRGLAVGATEAIRATVRSQRNVNGLRVDFRASPGLTIISGAHYAHQGVTGASTALDHTLSVSAQEAGQYSISAIIRVNGRGAAGARVISIPVTVGEVSATSRVRAKSTASTDSTGQRVKSLPGKVRER